MSDVAHGPLRRRAGPPLPIAPISLDKAVFISLWMEAVLYGIFVALFVGTIYTLVYKRSTKHVNRPLFLTSVAILLLATVHLLLDFVRCLQAFADAPFEGSSPTKYFSNISHPTNMAKTAIMVTENGIAEALLVYRAYIIGMRNPWALTTLGLLVLSTGITGYAFVYYLGSLVGTGASVFALELKHWIVSFFCITLVINVLCTYFIASHIWSSRKGSSKAGGNLTSFIHVVIESGTIYSAGLIIIITVYLLGSNAQYSVLDPLSQLIGIVVALITIRVAMGLSHEGSARSRDTSRRARSLSGSQARSQQQPTKPIAVQVTRGVHSRSDPAAIADIHITRSVSPDKDKDAGYIDEEFEYHSQTAKGAPPPY